MPFRTRSLSKVRLLLFAVLNVAMGAGVWTPASGEVLYVQDIQTRELLMGEKAAVLHIAYTDDSMRIDMKTRYTSSWMKRLFGGVKTNRKTTFVLLARDQVHEVNWETNKRFIYPLHRLSDVGWVRDRFETLPEAQEIIDSRYVSREPRLEVVVDENTERQGGYDCRRVTATLRLETFDKKKAASSITWIRQTVWLSEEVPGYGICREFRRKLAERMGLESERLGNLAFLLRYWRGPLDPIRDPLSSAGGFPVRTELTVDAEYVLESESDHSKTVARRLREETIVLRDALEVVDPGIFQVPEEFQRVQVE